MIEDDTIADTASDGGETVAEVAARLALEKSRRREEFALERLQGWLERPLWSGARNPVGPLIWPEGVCILAGLDPEWSADSDVGGWSFLPGGLVFYGFDTFPSKWHGLTELRASVEEHIGRLLGLGLKTMAPADAITAAVGAKLPPPWVAAYLDGEHGRRLPPKRRVDLRAAIGAEPEAPGKPKTVVELASAGGRGKRDKNKHRIAFFPTVKRLWEEGRTGAEIIARLEKENGDSAPPKSTVYGWLKEIKYLEREKAGR